MNRDGNDSKRKEEEDEEKSPSEETAMPAAENGSDEHQGENANQSSAQSTLQQLERDVVVKTTRNTGTSQPGAQAVAGSTGSDSQESDRQAATKATGNTGTTRPGAIAVPGSGRNDSNSLQQLEDIVASKLQANDNRTPAGAPANLRQLEENVAAKSVGNTGTTRPGAVAVSEPGRSTLRQLETEAAAKSMGNTGTTRPGAVAVSAQTSLHQLEQQVVTKAGAQPNSNVSGGTSLSQLEREITLKGSGNAKGSTPGAYHVPPASESSVVPSSLSQLEAQITAKAIDNISEPKSGASLKGDYGHDTHGARSLRQLEQDINAKSGGNLNTSTPGAVQVPASLQMLESQMLNKTRTTQQINTADQLASAGVTERKGDSKPSVGELSQLQQDMLIKAPSSRMSGAATTPAASSDLARSEADVLAKQQGNSNRYPISTQASNNVALTSLQAMERDIASKSRASEGVPHSQTATPSSANLLTSMRELEGHILDKTRTSSQQVARAPQIANAPDDDFGSPVFVGNSDLEANNQNLPRRYDVERPFEIDSRDTPVTEGIEAFVADNVVDATGVAVIMSEEDEEKREHRRIRRQLYALGITIFAIAALIIGVVVAKTGGSGGASVLSPTAAPTEVMSRAPTVAPSASPTSERLPLIIQCLVNNNISDSSNFSDHSSAQFLAANWISQDIVVQNDDCSAQRFIQRYALATLFFSVEGQKWDICGLSDPTCQGSAKSFGWLSQYSECEWYNVACAYQDLRVTSISFADVTTPADLLKTNFRGTLPTEISHLTDMETLDLSRFDLSGSIQEHFDSWSNLGELRLNQNRLSGNVPGFSITSNPLLRVVWLQSNRFKGEIPSTLTFLRSLWLGNNSLTGQIPGNIGSWSALSSLSLTGNTLNGTIPSGLFTLGQLDNLDLSGNRFEGSLPTTISQMSALSLFDIGGNSIGGELPESLFLLTGMLTFDVSNSQFKGTIPSSISNWAPTLQKLDLHGNAFSGPIPQSFALLTKLEELYIQDNLFTGSVQNLCGADRNCNAGGLCKLFVDCSIACTCCDERSLCH